MSKRRSGEGAGGHKGSKGPSKAAHNNRSDQLNPNNDKFHKARGLPGRPDGSGGGTPPNPRKR